MSDLLKVTCHSKSENINFEGTNGKDSAERITSLPTRSDDEPVITNTVEINETENERIFIHHVEAINLAETRRSKTGMESTFQDLHTANTSLNPLGVALMKATTVTAKYVYLNQHLRGLMST